MKTIALLLVSVTLCSAGYVREVRNPDGSVRYEYVGTPEECRKFRQWQAEFERNKAKVPPTNTDMQGNRQSATERRLRELELELERIENERRIKEFHEKMRGDR